MRPWPIRLALRRSRTQWAFLATVIAVSVLAATLLATLFLLSAATATVAARASLAETADKDVYFRIQVVPNGTVDEVLAGTDRAADELFGSVPYTRDTTVQGDWLAVPRDGRRLALAYLGSSDQLDSLITITAGVAPQPSNGGPVQVVVPQALLKDLAATVGDTITLAPYTSRQFTVDFTVRWYLYRRRSRRFGVEGRPAGWRGLQAQHGLAWDLGPRTHRRVWPPLHGPFRRRKSPPCPGDRYLHAEFSRALRFQRSAPYSTVVQASIAWPFATSALAQPLLPLSQTCQPRWAAWLAHLL